MFLIMRASFQYFISAPNRNSEGEGRGRRLCGCSGGERGRDTTSLSALSSPYTTCAAPQGQGKAGRGEEGSGPQRGGVQAWLKPAGRVGRRRLSSETPRTGQAPTLRHPLGAQRTVKKREKTLIEHLNLNLPKHSPPND